MTNGAVRVADYWADGHDSSNALNRRPAITYSNVPRRKIKPTLK